MTAKDPWDPETFMIVPVETTQTIMPESAAILGIQTFLKLARLPCRVVEKFNAANISPNGRSFQDWKLKNRNLSLMFLCQQESCQL